MSLKGVQTLDDPETRAAVAGAFLSLIARVLKDEVEEVTLDYTNENFEERFKIEGKFRH